MTRRRNIAAICFDKDGTLFHFSATWDHWAGGVIDALATDASGRRDEGRRDALAAAARYDLAGRTFLPDSPIIAGTNRQAAECIAAVLPERDVDDIEFYLMQSALDAPVQEAVPLDPYLAGLTEQGFRLGVVTNDTEAGVLAHLGAVGVTGRFDFIAGFDSGHGAKPEPEPLLAFAAAVDVPPDRVVMVGDSTHDLLSGRRAGMVCVGVLTGPAKRAELLPYADVVLDDIGALPGWLAAPE